MNITEVLNLVLPFASILVIIALIWFVVELVLMVRRARSAVNDIHKRLVPTLEHVEYITASLEPVAAKVDPLMERVALTIDAANLEIMRLDQILEDVNEITGTVSSATSTIEGAASAPLELVSNVTSRVRNAFKPRRASSESIALGDRRANEAAQEAVREDPRPTETAVREAKHAVAPEQNEGGGHQGVPAGSTFTAADMASEAKSPVPASAGIVAPEDKYFTYGAQPRSTAQSAASQPLSPKDEKTLPPEVQAAIRKATEEAQAQQAAQAQAVAQAQAAAQARAEQEAQAAAAQAAQAAAQARAEQEAQAAQKAAYEAQVAQAAAQQAAAAQKAAEEAQAEQEAQAARRAAYEAQVAQAAAARKAAEEARLAQATQAAQSAQAAQAAAQAAREAAIAQAIKEAAAVQAAKEAEAAAASQQGAHANPVAGAYGNPSAAPWPEAGPYVDYPGNAGRPNNTTI